MKKIKSRHNPKFVLVFAILFSALFLGGANQASARGNGYNRGGYSHYGYYQHRYYHHHHGYWGRRNGVQFWINVD
jgi:hypothetical protein